MAESEKRAREEVGGESEREQKRGRAKAPKGLKPDPKGVTSPKGNQLEVTS